MKTDSMRYLETQAKQTHIDYDFEPRRERRSAGARTLDLVGNGGLEWDDQPLQTIQVAKARHNRGQQPSIPFRPRFTWVEMLQYVIGCEPRLGQRASAVRLLLNLSALFRPNRYRSHV